MKTLFYQIQTLKTKMAEQNIRARDAMATVAVKAIILAVKAAAYAVDALEWWPNKTAAINYFKAGNLYRFEAGQIWYTLWADKEMQKFILRVRPGSMFMVLESHAKFPAGIYLHVLLNETPGWIHIEGNDQYAPWTKFERVIANDSTEQD